MNRIDPRNLPALQLLANNRPLDDFSGLTPNEMHQLLYDPLGKQSLLSIRQEIDGGVLDGLGFFRLVEDLLGIIRREGGLKLTATGALPRKVVLELYEGGHVHEEAIVSGIVKLSKESDSEAITTAYIVATLAGMARKSNGRLALTRNGERLLDAKRRRDLFAEVFAAFTMKFLWAYNDGYEDEQAGQFAWAYTLYLLDRFRSEERSVQFYADRYLTAFPVLIARFPARAFGSPQEDLADCYRLRAFERFLEWFGLVALRRTGEMFDPAGYLVRRTAAFERVFVMDR